MIRTIEDLGEAQDYIRCLFDGERRSCVVLTGAGISTDSGIPDFRSPGGIWSKRQPVQFQDFIRSHDSRMEDWERRLQMLDIFERAEPNAAHNALAKLGLAGRIDLLVTQNVDGLHQRSGFPQDRLIEIHGNSTYATCLECGRRANLPPLRDTVEKGQSPTCSSCGGLLKAAVISFGQAMPEAAFRKAAKASASADLFIVIGSSLVVYPAAELPVLAADKGAELVILNGEMTPVDPVADCLLRTRIAQTFENFTI
ncbi:SIR2 family NAD-dependent protein deacylase [Roseibium sediminis]|uniref:SIR2 family NAD-dependent protein deacylase n=1 Tax=Roseibium sediminis TaxID=1775174 RepID=UPI00123E0F54|nr:Sir2 family NAD-dependent protein deacetylase [Roseibium sediminis]